MDAEYIVSAIDMLIEQLQQKERQVKQYSEREWQDSDYNEGLNEGIDALNFLRKVVA